MFIKKYALALALALCTTSFADEYFEYPPKVDGCYQISTAQEMNGFIRIVNGIQVKAYSPDSTYWYYETLKDSTACGVLTADIELVADKDGWEPIKSFSGTFESPSNGNMKKGTPQFKWIDFFRCSLCPKVVGIAFPCAIQPGNEIFIAERENASRDPVFQFIEFKRTHAIFYE